ncbi:MAG: hypothetical protein ABFE07_27135 [Armatimonadia bacterium]
MQEGEELPPTPKLVRAYIKMRDARAALSAKYEEEDKKIKEQMEMVESYLLETCKRAGGNVSIPGVGNVIRGVSTRYWTSDWEAMHNFIKENNAVDLLERRIAQKAMGDFLKANPDKMPKGMNVESKYTVTVRRS